MSVAKISHKILDWRDILQLFMKKRFNCDQCGKIFARGCNLKVHIQILHEKDFEFIVMTVAKISPKPYIWKDIYKLLMNHTKHRIEITNHSWSWEEKDSIVINVAKILLEDAIWNYFYKMFMKLIHELNCEHCGKNFTKAFNL